VLDTAIAVTGAAVVGLLSAGGIPLGIAAERVLCTDTILYSLLLAAGGAVGDAARSGAGATVLLATGAGLVSSAFFVTTLGAAVAAAFGFHFADALLVPFRDAAVWVNCADALLHIVVRASRFVVDLAAIPVAGPAIISRNSAGVIPLNVAAERILGTDTLLNGVVLAADGVVGYATGA